MMFEHGRQLGPPQPLFKRNLQGKFIGGRWKTRPTCRHENRHRLRSCGFCLQRTDTGLLQSLGHEVLDFGTHSDASVDYPVFIRPVAEAVARGECEHGIVLGGSGNGEAIVANQVRGIRCALCWSHDTAHWSRAHNDANVLAIGQRTRSVDTRVGTRAGVADNCF